ncbi:DUF2157 domain-containing protein [Bacillota bacterium Lsc_1132]
MYVGSILVGAGILSFIASDWAEIGKPIKFLLIIGLYIVCNFAGFKLEQHDPKTSKSLYYLGILVFGAGGNRGAFLVFFHCKKQVIVPFLCYNGVRKINGRLR